MIGHDVTLFSVGEEVHSRSGEICVSVVSSDLTLSALTIRITHHPMSELIGSELQMVPSAVVNHWMADDASISWYILSVRDGSKSFDFLEHYFVA